MNHRCWRSRLHWEYCCCCCVALFGNFSQLPARKALFVHLRPQTPNTDTLTLMQSPGLDHAVLGRWQSFHQESSAQSVNHHETSCFSCSSSPGPLHLRLVRPRSLVPTALTCRTVSATSERQAACRVCLCLGKLWLSPIRPRVSQKSLIVACQMHRV
jgi:hypothetical protein